MAPALGRCDPAHGLTPPAIDLPGTWRQQGGRSTCCSRPGCQLGPEPWPVSRGGTSVLRGSPRRSVCASPRGSWACVGKDAPCSGRGCRALCPSHWGLEACTRVSCSVESHSSTLRQRQGRGRRSNQSDPWGDTHNRTEDHLLHCLCAEHCLRAPPTCLKEQTRGSLG